MTETMVVIPGDFVATYNDEGGITALEFYPRASNAGAAPAPAAYIEEGDVDLDVEDTDGPFWKAMQTAIVEANLLPSRALRVVWAE